MKNVFVETTSYHSLMAGIQSLQQRGAREASFLVTEGMPGLGKTTASERWAVQTRSTFLRAKSQWTPAWFLRELLQGLNKMPEHSRERMFNQSTRALIERSDAARRDGKPYALVIDEVDHISRNGALLETIRDLSDHIEMPVLFIGMGKVRHNITRFPQIASRIGQWVEFTPLSLEDTKTFVTELSDVKIKDELVQLIHRESQGRCREIKEAIASVERVGRRTGAMVGIAEMDKKVLMNDRATGQPIHVKG
jgi:DNA transposition AAA+ family ATPase